MLVVDDVNFPRLGEYLERNSGTVFDIVPASYEPDDPRKPLSVYNRMEIVRRFGNSVRNTLRITDKPRR